MSIKLCISLMIVAALITVVMAEEKGTYTVNVTQNAKLGNYMTNVTFFTLYYFENDAPGTNSSNCNGTCAINWPPFYVENLIVNPQLDIEDFSVFTRADGQKQIAYKNYPLYFYIGDKKAYETNGQGVNKAWFVINPKDFPPSNS
ncbi:MAG: hypothetical protein MUO26_14860 [Methanotrichaceae archaeon]|nr:hypothetical protein [Methanotrichaceae archaeon]